MSEDCVQAMDQRMGQDRSQELGRSQRSPAMLLAFLVLVLSLITDLRVLPTDGGLGQDFNDFYVAAVAQGQGLNPYDGAVLTRIEERYFGHASFSNTVASPPAFLVVVRPFTLFSPRLGYLIWLAISSLVYGLALGSLGEALHCRKDPLFWALAISPPTIIAAFLGQITLLLLAVSIWAIRMLIAERWWASGVLLSLTLVKPHIMIVPIALLLALSWRRGGAKTGAILAISAVVITVTTLPFAEPQAFTDWLAALGRYSSKFDRWQPDISSLAGIYLPYLPRTVGRLLSSILLLVGLGIVGYLARWGFTRRVASGSATWWRLFGLGLAVWLALVPYIHPYDDVLLLLPLALLLRRPKGVDPQGFALLAIITMLSLPELDLMGFRPNLTFSYTLVPVLATIMALWGRRRSTSSSS